MDYVGFDKSTTNDISVTVIAIAEYGHFRILGETREAIVEQPEIPLNRSGRRRGHRENQVGWIPVADLYREEGRKFRELRNRRKRAKRDSKRNGRKNRK